MLNRIKQHLTEGDELEYIRNETVNGPIADIGCGSGRIAAEIARIGEPVVGIDVDPGRIVQFSEVDADTHGICASATDIPFPDERFELVNSYTVYEHIPERIIHRYLRELYRILKPGGVLFLVHDAFFYRVLRRTRLLFPRRGPDPTHINMVTPLTVTKKLEKADFIVRETHHAPFDTWDLQNRVTNLFATKGHIVAEKPPK